MQPAVYLTRARAAWRGAQLVRQQGHAFYRVIPKQVVNSDKSVDFGFTVGLFNRDGDLTGLAMEA